MATLGEELREIAVDVLTDIDEDLGGPSDIYFQVVNEDPEAEDADQFVTIFTLRGKRLFEKTKRQASIYTDAGRTENFLLWVANDAATATDMLAAMTTGFDDGDIDEPRPVNQPATHVLIGDDRYTINRVDVVKPTELDPFWQIPCDHEFV